jgi:excisionase family DNA binding protein
MADDLKPAEWITTAEAAELTGYHVKYVRRLVREGKIAGAKRGRDWWVDKASVESRCSLVIQQQRFHELSNDAQIRESTPA